MRKIIIIYIIYFLSIVNSNAQFKDFKFRNLNVDDGLSNSWVTSIYKDSEGYMWFGTENTGVNKFDGYNFTIFKNNPRNKNSLNSNKITLIYEDGNNNLWISASGLNKYNRNLDVFNPVPEFDNIYIINIQDIDNDRLLITSLFDLIIYYPKIDSIEYINFQKQSDYKFTQNSLIRYNDSTFMLASNNGLLLINTCNFNLIPIKNDVIKNIEITSIFCDTKKRVWLGSVNSNLYCANFSNNNLLFPKIEKFQIGEGRIIEIQEDNSGKFWINSEIAGINIIDLKSYKKGRINYDANKDQLDYFKNMDRKSISDIYIDNQGTIWLSKLNKGIYYYNELMDKFTNLRNDPTNLNSLNDNNVVVIYEEKNKLWIGANGLDIYNKLNNKWEHYYHDGNNLNTLGSDAICAIYRDSYNNMWIGTWAGGLNLYDETTNTFKTFLVNENDSNSISSNNIFDIIQDKDGFLWIATMNGGICRFNYANNTFTRYVENNNENSINSNWTKEIIESEYNELWIATSFGLNVFNKKENKFTSYLHDTINVKSISSNQIVTIFEDSKLNIWIGTINGLNLYDRENNNFVFYNEEEGLPNNVIRAICEDNHGNLWISTNMGLSKFKNAVNKPAAPEFVNYDKSDGLQGNEFNSRACFKGEDGRLYFGGNNGINIFFPDSIKENPYKPKVIFTNFLIFNKPIEIGGKDSPLLKHISKIKKITLSYKQSAFSIQYAGINYIAPEKNKYAYIMEGFDDEWNDVDSKREATYTNLDPGTYTFKVKAANNDGLWNEEGISLTIIITPPFWQTWWFKTSGILFILGLIFSYVYYRINAYEKQKKYLEKIVKERTREIELKNQILLDQTYVLNETNTLLKERQNQIEEQSEELKANAEELNVKNKDLQKLNATKDKLFSIIAHDLKNPFNSILGFSELLDIKYDSYDDTKKKHFVQLIHSSSRSLFELLQNLLHWARSQTSDISENHKEFYINELIEQNIILFRNMLKNKGLKIHNKVIDKFKVIADRNMVDTVLRNLLSNSIKFTENGEITINAKNKGNYIKVSIKDAGIGISSDKLKKLFNSYEFHSTEGTRGESGTGLGLIICEEFVKRNKGKISVKSIVGEGTEFVFTIPAASN